jgi:hypothetical protein
MIEFNVSDHTLLPHDKITIHSLADDNDVRYIRIVPTLHLLRYMLDKGLLLPHDLGYGEASEDGWLLSERDIARCVVKGDCRSNYGYYLSEYFSDISLGYIKGAWGDLESALLGISWRYFNNPDFWLPWLRARADHIDDHCEDLPVRRYTEYNESDEDDEDDEDADECVCREVHQRRCCRSLYRLGSGVNALVVNYDAWRRACGCDTKGKPAGHKFVMTSTAPELIKDDNVCDEFALNCVREWVREGKLVPCEQEVKEKA